VPLDLAAQDDALAVEAADPGRHHDGQRGAAGQRRVELAQQAAERLGARWRVAIELGKAACEPAPLGLRRGDGRTCVGTIDIRGHDDPGPIAGCAVQHGLREQQGQCSQQQQPQREQQPLLETDPLLRLLPDLQPA
jgi:hypothetical protein